MKQLTRRDFGKLSGATVLSAILSLSLVLSPLALTGCTSTQVRDTITVAAEVANSAAAIIAPANQEIAEYFNLVAKYLKDADTVYSGYLDAAKSDKPAKAAELHQVLQTITANLDTILHDAGIKAPSLITEIKVAVAVVNSAVTLILAHLPASQSTQSAAVRANVKAQAASLPVVPGAKSAQDLAAEWNTKVGASHPGAVVNAPRHRKLGLF